MGARGRKKREKLSSLPGWKNQTGWSRSGKAGMHVICITRAAGKDGAVFTVWGLEQREEKRESELGHGFPP